MLWLYDDDENRCDHKAWETAEQKIKGFRIAARSIFWSTLFMELSSLSSDQTVFVCVCMAKSSYDWMGTDLSRIYSTTHGCNRLTACSDD